MSVALFRRTEIAARDLRIAWTEIQQRILVVRNELVYKDVERIFDARAKVFLVSDSS